MAKRRHRWAAVGALGILIGLPTAAFIAAPSARAQGGAPASQLGGLNTSANAAGIDLEPFLPGLFPAGNAVTGNFVQASIPYASSTTTTGPSTSGIASPAWPGSVAADLGTAFGTVSSQFPSQLQKLLNDPAVARSSYPPQPTAAGSGSYAPPGGSQSGVGTASTQASDSGSTASAVLNDTKLIPGVLEVASSTSFSNAVVNAGSVQTTAESHFGTITLLNGLIRIDGVASMASAASNGSAGTGQSDLHIGSVTVAGLAASIGPNGIQLTGQQGRGSFAFDTVNTVLQLLKQAGISITTLSPTQQENGSSASISSGALQLSFADNSLPNFSNLLARLIAQILPVSSPCIPLPDFQLCSVPFPSSAAFQATLGLSNAGADATSLPPLPPFKASLPPAVGGVAPSVGSNLGSAGKPATTEFIPGTAGTPATSGGVNQAPTVSNFPGSQNASLPALSPAATLFGLPVKVAWIVIAILLSIVVAGPMLAYANWQLLRGRT